MMNTHLRRSQMCTPITNCHRMPIVMSLHTYALTLDLQLELMAITPRLTTVASRCVLASPPSQGINRVHHSRNA